MSGIVALEGQINGIIKEYLDYFGFEQTLEKFNEECGLKGKPVANLDSRTKSNSNQKINFIMNEMIHLLHQGQRKEFFRRWIENVPSQTINDDLNAQKIELELNIHFAIFPFRKGGKDAKSKAFESIGQFKNYIETKGKVLCQTKEFLPYFGLPYVDNPQNTFPELFSDAWLADLQIKLEDFLKESLKMQNQPRIVELYTHFAENKLPNSNTQMQLIEAEKKAAHFFKKFNKAQADYHNALGLTAELVDSLESTINGKPISSEYLANLLSRLVSPHLKQSIDLTRPGTAGDYIRKSLAYQKSNLERPQTSNFSLDISKIKHDLMNRNEKHQILLLQALRWRLTKAENPEQRHRSLSAYIAGDLLGCRNSSSRGIVIDLINSNNETIKQYTARLVNAIASLNHGQTYLASNPEIIKMINNILIHETQESFTKSNLLAGLQKLSLKRNIQTLLINQNMIDWLIDLLENNEELSDYSLEYAAGLLMNLSLRSAGKRCLAINYKKNLKVISELLGNPNFEIRDFIHGTLFAILDIPILKEEAIAMNLIGILNQYLTDGTPKMNHQIQILINRIKSNEKRQLNPESDDEDGEDEEDEDPIIMEAELDRAEVFLNLNPDDLIGEILLKSHYSIHNDSRSKSRVGMDQMNESIFISRAITPSNLRQSMMFQAKQLDLSENITTPNRELPPPTNPRNLTAKIDRPSDALKAPKSNPANQRSTSNDRKPSFRQRNNTEDDKNKKVNILVLDSNDASNNSNIEEVIQSPHYPPPHPIHQRNSLKESSNIFASKPKIQRTPEQSYAGSIIDRRKSNSTSVNQSGSLIIPKYSVSEPRPSSANSTRSKNSSSSGHSNQNENSVYSGIKKK